MNKRPEKVSLHDLDKAPLSTPKEESPIGIERWRESFSELSEINISLSIENGKLKQQLSTKTILDNLLEPYASKAFWFMCFYAFSVFFLILMNGFGCFTNQIPESVMNFLVGSTAATVIGLVGMVLTGIFVGARK